MRAKLYVDHIHYSLSEAARKALLSMDPAKYEYQSDFAKRYVAQGRMEGEAKGKAEVLIKQLTLKFGVLSEEVVARVRNAPVADLDVMAERILTANTLVEVLA